MRPFEVGLVPAARQFQHAADAVSVRQVHQHRMTEKIFRVPAAENVHNQAPVNFDRMHLIADFVHVRDKRDARRLRARLRVAQMQEEIPRRVRFRFRPFRQELLDFFADGSLVPARAVNFHQLADERELPRGPILICMPSRRPFWFGVRRVREEDAA